jgi:hypothetical protein
MEKTVTLTVNTPCSQKWSSFTPTREGGYCGSCNKVVIDFTKMTDAEILAYFTNTGGHLCGRFLPTQLKSYHLREQVNVRPGFLLLKAGVLGALMLLVAKPASASAIVVKAPLEINDNATTLSTNVREKGERTLSGIVKDEFGEILPGVNVWIKGTETGTVTGADGKFQISVDAGDVLAFSFIGFVTKELTITDKIINDQEFTLTLDMQVTLGEVAVNHVYGEEPSALKTWWQKVKSIF